jgi:hypothetical protein
MDKLEPTWKGLESLGRVVDEKTDPVFTLDDDFGDMEAVSALSKQVGGDHYKEQGIQPFEITFKNFGYDGVRHSCYTKVNKYLTREKNQHRENIEKAIHVLQIQLEYLDRGTNK